MRNQSHSVLIPAILAGLFSAATVLSLPALAQNSNPTFKVLKTIPIGGEGEWGYASIAPDGHHVYVPRTGELQIVNIDTGKVDATIPALTSQVVHSVVTVPGTKLGFATAGKDENIAAFDIDTLKIKARITSHVNPNYSFYDPFSKHVVVNNHEDVTIVDPNHLDEALAVIKLGSGGGLEQGVSDNKGNVWVANENQNVIDHIDMKTNKLIDRLTVAPGKTPAGMAIDLKTNRLFVACRTDESQADPKAKTPGVLVVMDAATGKVLTSSSIGIYGSSTVIWDPTLGVILTPSGTGGTLTVSKEVSSGKFGAIQTLPTTVSARGIAYDPKTHRGYLPGNLPDGKFGLTVVGLTSSK